MKIIRLNSLKNQDLGLSETLINYLVESAIYCLTSQGHESGISFPVQTKTGLQEFTLVWDYERVNQSMFEEPAENVEQAAECLGLLLALNLTNYRYFIRAVYASGLNFWLSENNSSDRQNIRLEVSGMIHGSKKDMTNRFASKMKQIQQKDKSNSKALVSIINFTRPESIFSDLDFELPFALQEEVNLPFKRFSIRINNGRLEIAGQQSDGSIVFSDGTSQLESGIFVSRHSKWTPVLKELESLINKPNLLEQELQDFFELYPELVLGEEYNHFIPQASIVNDDGYRWRADFILTPYDQLSFSKILELKLPASKISLKRRSGHHRYSKELIEAIWQLQDYQRAFDSPGIKQKFKEKYHTDVFKPALHLVIGRRDNISNSTDFLWLQQRNQIIVTDWDTLHEKLKRKYS